MPLFTEADKPNYFPNISLTGAEFDAFVAQVQSIIESPLGANGSLELTRRKEILRINTTHQTEYLTYKPIDLTVPPIIQARIGNAVAAVSGNVIPQQSWILVDPLRYQIDEITGKLSLYTNMGGALAHAYGGVNYGHQNLFTEVQAEYDAGYNFSSTTDPIVKQIKSHAGAIARYIWGDDGNSAFNGRQLRSENVNDEYSVSYFEGRGSSGDGLYGTGQGQIPKNLMQFFINISSVAYGL